MIAGHYHNFDSSEDRWQDQLHRWRGMRDGDPRVVIVTIDDKSISEVGQYPWPRSTYVPLLSNLKRWGAQLIGFDVLFLEESRPEEDVPFIAAVRKAGNVVLGATLDQDVKENRFTPYTFIMPWEPLREAALASGLVFTGFCIEKDGAIRRVPVLIGSKRTSGHCRDFDPVQILESPERVPTFSTVLAGLRMRMLPEDLLRRHGPVLNLDFPGERVWQEELESGPTMNGKPIPVERYEYAFPRFSSIDVLKGRLNQSERAKFKNAIVLIGATATGTYDSHPTPFGERTAGVEVHAAAIDNFIGNRDLKAVPAWLAVLAPLVMILLADGIIRMTPLSGSLIAVGTGALWAALSFQLFTRGIRLPMVAPNAALAFAYFVMLTQRIIHEQREKRWVKDTFAQYLSPKVIQVLADDPEKLKLGGDSRDMSIFFIDIAGFTSIAERMDPKALSEFLNHYLTALTNIILKNDGVVDKYIGDCIMAFWNAPMDQPRHRELACLSALECVHEAERIGQELRGSGIKEKITIRVGVNSGHAVVGNMGSQTRFSYTVIGDAVNVASRLEGANKFFGSHIMASEEAVKGCLDRFDAKELGRIRVVGKDVPLRVYDLLELKGKLPAARRSALDLHHEALEHYVARRFEKAANGFTELLKRDAGDKTAKLYLNETEKLLAEPPGKDWDGVFNLSSK